MMQFAGDAAALFVLQSHQTAGKMSQRRGPLIHHFFQPFLSFTDRLLENFAVMDIGTSAIPPDNLAIMIANGHSARAEPTVLLIPVADTIFGFIVLARL